MMGRGSQQSFVLRTSLLGVGLFVFSFIFLSIGQVTEASEKDYWASTGIDFSFYREKYDNKSCHRSALRFQGCVYSLNEAAAELKPANIVVTQEIYNAMPDKGRITKEFGEILFVEYKKPTTRLEPIPAYRKAKQERIDLLKSMEKLFLSPTSNNVNFDEIFDWVQKDIIEKSSAQARIAGEMVNLNMAILEGPYSAYLPAEELADMTSGGPLTVGIGVEISEVDQKVVIIRPIKGGPADKAGLQPKDLVVSVDGKSVVGQGLADVIKVIRGEPGTAVNIGVKRREKNLNFDVVRAGVRMPSVMTENKSGQEGDYQYIEVNDFMEAHICENVRAAVKQASADNKKGVILDLRGNPGGNLDTSLCVAGIFLPSYLKILTEKSLRGGQDRSRYSTHSTNKEIPVVVIIDARSASASEVVSGILQDLNRALVIGVRSFGKGTVQQLEAVFDPLNPKKTTLYKKVMWATYHLPSGRSPQITGILPNVEVYTKPVPGELEKFAIRQEDEYLSVVPAQNAPWIENRPEYVQRIKNCMAERGKALEKYAPSANDLVPDDFQLFSAIDMMDCQILNPDRPM